MDLSGSVNSFSGALVPNDAPLKADTLGGASPFVGGVMARNWRDVAAQVAVDAHSRDDGADNEYVVGWDDAASTIADRIRNLPIDVLDCGSCAVNHHGSGQESALRDAVKILEDAGYRQAVSLLKYHFVFLRSPPRAGR